MVTSISIRKNLFFAALAFICCSNALQAQDIITLKDGYEIQAKVLEIEDQIIKYKEFDNQEGPIYDIQKSDVFSIKYEDGTKYLFSKKPVEVIHVSSKPQLTYKNGVRQNGTKIRPEQVRQMMSKNSKALQKYNSGRSLLVTGNIIASPCAFMLGWDLGTRLVTHEGNDVLLGIGAAGTVIGCVMLGIGENHIEKSVSLYNSSSLHGTTAYNLNFGITGSGGVGFTLNF